MYDIVISTYSISAPAEDSAGTPGKLILTRERELLNYRFHKDN
jgi:hypothetical protein